MHTSHTGLMPPKLDEPTVAEQQQRHQLLQHQHAIATSLTRNLQPPTPTTTILADASVPNPCGNRFPVYDGHNNNRMMCVDQYGSGTGSAGRNGQLAYAPSAGTTPPASFDPYPSQPATFAAIDAAGQMLETFVQARNSNPCAAGQRPVIDERSPRVQCISALEDRRSDNSQASRVFFC